MTHWYNELVKVNRSLQQTQFLLDLCEGNLSMLLQVEVSLMNKHLNYCPSTKEEIQFILLNK